MSNFDETSEVAACTTVWGRWYQTMDEVYVEVNLEEGTIGKQVKVNIMPKRLHVSVKGETVIEGDLTATVKSDDSVWTIGKYFFLYRGLKVPVNPSICQVAYYIYTTVHNRLYIHSIHVNLDTCFFCLQNPGMDFSNAEITGNYHTGGPELPGS
ncbi:nudC domain-containing protein 2-like [Ruditapes philippinarum]|uniref:nudC domain-containing protein 2-like n=1 Tax=Ruditapes philippinarum TaxID=129788 RepID=UPI00295C2133|nr:nudC domain-containing protein 2-like [Ruditapes philippinarum]